jgi:hypothetical protein
MRFGTTTLLRRLASGDLGIDSDMSHRGRGEYAPGPVRPDRDRRRTRGPCTVGGRPESSVWSWTRGGSTGTMVLAQGRGIRAAWLDLPKRVHDSLPLSESGRHTPSRKEGTSQDDLKGIRASETDGTRSWNVGHGSVYSVTRSHPTRHCPSRCSAPRDPGQPILAGSGGEHALVLECEPG